MTAGTFYGTLEDISFKYQRLKSLIAMTQSSTAECMVSQEELSNVLLEIELEMGETNEALEDLLNAGRKNRQQGYPI